MGKQRRSAAIRREPAPGVPHSGVDCGSARHGPGPALAAPGWLAFQAAGASAEWAVQLRLQGLPRAGPGELAPPLGELHSGGGGGLERNDPEPALAAPGQPASPAAGAPTARAVQSRLRRLPRAGPDSRQAWARRRARCKDVNEFVGRGNAPGSHVALRRESCATVVCRQAGCTALVHLHSARRQARAEERDRFAAGDGCAGPLCSRNWRRSQFAAGQRRMAVALAAAERFLAPWPRSCGDSHLYFFPSAAAENAAERALAALQPAANCPCRNFSHPHHPHHPRGPH